MEGNIDLHSHAIFWNPWLGILAPRHDRKQHSTASGRVQHVGIVAMQRISLRRSGCWQSIVGKAWKLRKEERPLRNHSSCLGHPARSLQVSLH